MIMSHPPIDFRNSVHRGGTVPKHLLRDADLLLRYVECRILFTPRITVLTNRAHAARPISHQSTNEALFPWTFSTREEHRHTSPENRK